MTLPIAQSVVRARSWRVAWSLVLMAWIGSIMPLSQAATVIHAGRLIDGVSREARLEQTVIIEQGRIVAIERG